MLLLLNKTTGYLILVWMTLTWFSKRYYKLVLYFKKKNISPKKPYDLIVLQYKLK